VIPFPFRIDRSRLLAALCACIPVVVDLSLRHAWLRTLEGSERTLYGVTAAATTALWALGLLAVAPRQPIARSLATASALLLSFYLAGTQAFTFAKYRAYLDADAILVGTSIAPHAADLRYSGLRALACFAPSLALCIFITVGTRAAPNSIRSRGALACLDLAALLLVGLALTDPHRGARQGRTPEALALSAYGQLARARWDHNETVLRVHPSARTPERLSRVTMRAPKRNVILILNESLRAASSCVRYDPSCVTTPFSNEAARDRIAFENVRALDSTTAISLSVYLSGVLPTASRSEALSAPVAWEYASAAGYQTGYYASQNVLFGNQGKLIENVELSHSRFATELEWNPDLDTGADDMLAAQALTRDLDVLGPAHFSVVHFCNTHYPYRIEASDAPFQPESDETGPYYKRELSNRYHDAVYHQDRAIAHVIETLKQRTEPTVVVYISDHGEQLHEHGAHGHTGTLFDPEIRVPLWIWSSHDALTGSERAKLEALQTKPLFGVDVLPTLLDFLSLYDAPELRTQTARLPGTSLLRGGSPLEKTWPLSNCTALWGCAFRNWGVMQGTRKLFQLQGEGEPKCFDLATDPNEEHSELSRCSDLMPAFQRLELP
jgi:glucan phosphoethanolaminetransferase (alkaline phosphatase superfamily)